MLFVFAKAAFFCSEDQSDYTVALKKDTNLQALVWVRVELPHADG